MQRLVGRLASGLSLAKVATLVTSITAVLGLIFLLILLKNPHDFLPFLGLVRWRMSHSL
jgi:hypothetical protein